MKNSLLIVLIALASSVFSSVLHAQPAEISVIAMEPFTLYRKVQGKVQKAELPAKTAVFVSENHSGPWYRVRAQQGTEWVQGNIHRSQFSSFAKSAKAGNPARNIAQVAAPVSPQPNPVSEIRSQAPTKAEQVKKGRSAFGLTGAASQSQQAAQIISSNSGQSFNLSTLDGTSASAALFFDHEMSPRWLLRGFFSYRQTRLSGDAALVLSQSLSQPTSIERNLQSAGIGGVAKLYLTSAASVGLGLEVARVISEEMIIAQSPGIQAEESDLSYYYTPFATVGYDFYVGSVAILPEIRVGGQLGETKPVLFSEVALSLAYRL